MNPLSGRTPRPAIIAIVVLAVANLAIGGIGLASQASPASPASETPEKLRDGEALSTANAMALPETYRVSLTFEEGKETMTFSTVTAMRHFSLAPAERRLRFRGRLWLQPDGRELLDFSMELGQQIAQKNGSTAVATDGSWSGSAYVESGRPIELVKNPNSTLTVTLTRQ